MNRFRANPRFLAPILAAMAMLGPFSIDAIFPAFDHIQHEFHASAAGMQQIISLYLAAVAVMALLHGAISDALGRRIVLLVSLGVFALSCVGCALSPNLPVLLGFRLLQGAAGGAGLIIGRAIIRDRFAGPEATHLMAQVTLIFGLAPAIAPVVGGLILEVGSWRMIFAAMFGFTLLLILACLQVLPETHPRHQRIPFGLLPLLRSYGEILGDVRFLLLGLSAALSFGALFLYISLAPTIILDWLHLGQNAFFWLFVPTIGGIMLGAFLSQRLSRRMGARPLLRIGWMLIGSACIFAVAESEFLPPGLPWTVLPPGLIGIGASLAQPTLTLMMLDRFPHRRGTAASLQAAISLTTNALVSGTIAIYVGSDPLPASIAASLLAAAGFLCWWLQDRLPREGTTVALAAAMRVESAARPDDTLELNQVGRRRSNILE